MQGRGCARRHAGRPEKVGIMRLLRDIGYFLILVLMIIGITGILYHAIGENGWVERFLGGVFDQGFAIIAMTLVGVVLAGWLARRWLIATQTNALLNDFLMYGMVALGVLFLGRLIMYGSL
jgi:hypothetical protein